MLLLMRVTHDSRVPTPAATWHELGVVTGVPVYIDHHLVRPN